MKSSQKLIPMIDVDEYLIGVAGSKETHTERIGLVKLEQYLALFRKSSHNALFYRLVTDSWNHTHFLLYRPGSHNSRTRYICFKVQAIAELQMLRVDAVARP